MRLTAVGAWQHVSPVWTGWHTAMWKRISLLVSLQVASQDVQVASEVPGGAVTHIPT